jgi:mRNA-degrading endonuclease RelE of RelBE toxin-antitoxin system
VGIDLKCGIAACFVCERSAAHGRRTASFTRSAEKLLTAEEQAELVLQLASNPQSGDEIPGTGGVRKMRFGAKGKGKSSGVRVIYYYYDFENPLYAILLYGKNEQGNLTPKQKKDISAFAAGIKAAARTQRLVRREKS